MSRIRVLVGLLAIAIFGGLLQGDDPKKPDTKSDTPAKHTLPQGWKALGLTDEQKKKVYAIEDDYVPKIAALEKQIRRVREGRFGEQGDEKPPERIPPKEPVRRDREDFRARFYPALKDIADAYDKLWDDSYSQVVRPPKERPEKVVEDRLKRLQSLQKQVTEAIGKLDEHGAYKDASTEKARETATALLRERTVLLALVEMALREGSRWTETEPHIAHEHKNKAKALEAEWEAALEEIGGR